MPKFSEYEKYIIAIFKGAESFIWKDGKEYKIIVIGKPRPPKGECKTDVYILAENSKHENLELKISVKKDDAEFLENKTTPERAEAIFGKKWLRIIQNSTKNIKGEFHKRKLIFKKKFRKTEEGAITLGWKFEIMYHPGGDLSGKLKLTKEEIREVFIGYNLPKEKKDAVVKGNVIINSGVANYILFSSASKVKTLHDIIESSISLDDFLKDQKSLYFACKALNYRSLHKPKPKWDGNRPLAVFVKWSVKHGKLNHRLVFNKPLSIRGNETAVNLICALKTIGKENTKYLNRNNVNKDRIIFE